jgi:hypothetical protein
MVRAISDRAALAAGLSLIGIVAMAPMLYGRSVTFTVVLATLELHLLLRATLRGESRALFLVPLLFAIWANVHIQFLHGLFLYGCFWAQAWLDASRRNPDPEAAARASSLAVRMTWIGIACVLATLVNPYHVRIYEPILSYFVQAPMIYTQIQEFQPPRFTSIPTWMTLALALFVFGAARRLLYRPFLLLMFVVAAGVALRSARDTWFLVVSGSAVLAAAFRSARAEPLAAHPLVVAAGTACVIAVAADRMDVSADALAARERERFPVAAAEFIEAHRLAGPMYNDFTWGGYLMWRLPEWKVSIDGRTYVYDVDYLLDTLRVWMAEPGWDQDPHLLAAGFVVGPQDLPLTSSLKADSRFRVVYEDAVAAVFVRNEPEGASLSR